MIISASRRTDIPAFYSEWFINRIRAGYCCAVNPFNRKQVSYVSLQPPDVDVIVFWTKDAGPLLRYLGELDSRGFRYYFQYTITGYPRVIEPNTPPLEQSVGTFARLSDMLGKRRVIWRYDPIMFSTLTTPSYHRRRFTELADALASHTTRVVISIVDRYRAAARRLARLAQHGVEEIAAPVGSSDFDATLEDMVACADSHGLRVSSCAEEIDLTRYGVVPGKCVDDELIREVFHVEVSHRKDTSQRKECGCVVSRDIGCYDTCLHGCEYCYATRSNVTSANANRDHHSDSPSMVGWHDCVRPHMALF